jgi:hypothetical protein
VTHPTGDPIELIRLRTLLAATRLERDQLARQLAAVLDDAPVAVCAEQQPLPGMGLLPQ